MKIEIRSATADDIKAVCGERNPVSIRAYTITLDDKPVCVAGITLSSPALVFSDFDRTVNVPKRTVYRYAKRMLEKLRALGIPAITTELQGRSRFLESLGLELDHVDGEQHFYRI